MKNFIIRILNKLNLLQSLSLQSKISVNNKFTGLTKISEIGIHGNVVDSDYLAVPNSIEINTLF